MENEIIHDEQDGVFYADAEGKRAVLEYDKTDTNTLRFYHTYVPPELRGRHLGSKLVKYGLDYARDNGCMVDPACSFVRTYVRRRKEYEPIIVS